MATKATLGDVHIMLMEQLQRLNETEPGSDEMRDEVERSNAMAGLAKTVVSNASLMVKVAGITQSTGAPRMLAGTNGA